MVVEVLGLACLSMLFLHHSDSAELHPKVHSFLCADAASLAGKDLGCGMDLRREFAQVVVLLVGERQVKERVWFEAYSFANDGALVDAEPRHVSYDPFREYVRW